MAGSPHATASNASSLTSGQSLSSDVWMSSAISVRMSGSSCSLKNCSCCVEFWPVIAPSRTISGSSWLAACTYCSPHQLFGADQSSRGVPATSSA
eukprot:444347-Prymnesium_polylepis.1